MTEPPSLSRRVLAVGVGIFALWEIVFLPAANLIDFVPRRSDPHDTGPSLDPYQKRGAFTTAEPLQRAAEVAGDVLDFWSEATGQEQGWSLFSPGCPPHSLFQAVELRFPDGGVVEIRSRFEPTDRLNPSPRMPLVHDRVFNFEALLTTPGGFCSTESLKEYPEMWSRELPPTVRDHYRPLLAWLRWHVREYRKTNPDRGGPAEVILKYRYIPTRLPGEPWGWTKPAIERPYARWKPGGATEPGYLPLEGYDPVAERFVRLKAEGQP
ncbi:MAG: hypothetical protein JWO38_171 [Gemmataceae bacterium]|nr:hypothetical protein [Gemmataceae bacterium]